MGNPASEAQRILDRDGRLNIERLGAPPGFFGDLYHFLLISSWLRVLTLFILSYVGANALFAVLYVLGGDSIDGARPGSLADAFFFSVQTMATIGYGHLVPRTLWAQVLVTIESFVGLMGLALATGVVFGKFSRPTARVLFSRYAVITTRDGAPCLMFRMANQRGNQIVEARIHVVLARDETTFEGETLRRLYDLKMARAEHALFALSWTAVHLLTKDSPLFGVTPESLAANEAEIIVSLTGLDETFAQTVHARHSYVADEIICGARFVDILSRAPDGHRRIDYTLFHEIVRTDAK